MRMVPCNLHTSDRETPKLKPSRARPSSYLFVVRNRISYTHSPVANSCACSRSSFPRNAAAANSMFQLPLYCGKLYRPHLTSSISAVPVDTKALPGKEVRGPTLGVRMLVFEFPTARDCPPATQKCTVLSLACAFRCCGLWFANIAYHLEVDLIAGSSSRIITESCIHRTGKANEDGKYQRESRGLT